MVLLYSTPVDPPQVFRSELVFTRQLIISTIPSCQRRVGARPRSLYVSFARVRLYGRRSIPSMIYRVTQFLLPLSCFARRPCGVCLCHVVPAVFDLTRLKNESSLFSMTVRELTTQYRLLLTGTPLQVFD